MLRQNIKAAFAFATLITFAPLTNATLVVPALEKNKIGHNLSLTGSFKSAKTSVSRTTYSGSFNYNYGTEQNQILAFGNINYGDVDDKKYLDKYLFHIRNVKFYVINSIRLETFLQNESNDLAFLASRSVIGGGLSHLWGKDDTQYTYHFMTGIMYEEETHSIDSTLDRSTTRLTISNQLEYQVFDSSQLTFTNYIQPELNDFNNYRLILDLTLSIPLNEKLSIGFGGNYRKYTEAYEGIPENTHSFNTSMTYRF